MAQFLPGNQFWKARSSAGAKPKFSSAEQLRKACEEYFQWVEDNPLYEMKPFAYQGEVTVTPIAKMRAMTQKALCLFLDIHEETWRSYRNNPVLSEVTSWADSIIYDQKFSGAAADMLNANIIARDLGLKDASSVDHSSSDGTMSPQGSDVTDALKRKYEAKD